MDFNFDDLVAKDESLPTDFEQLLFYFFEQGIGFKEFCSYPIPYIVSIQRVAVYRQKQREDNK